MLFVESIKLGTELYYYTEEYDDVYKVRVTSDGGGTKGCCIECVDDDVLFDTDVAYYEDLYLYPFVLDLQYFRNEINVRDLAGNHLFKLPSDYVIEEGLLQKNMESIYTHVNTHYRDVVEDMIVVVGGM